MKKLRKFFAILMVSLLTVSISTEALAHKHSKKDDKHKEKYWEKDDDRCYYNDGPGNNGKGHAYGLYKDKKDKCYCDKCWNKKDKKYRKDCDKDWNKNCNNDWEKDWSDKNDQERFETIMQGTADFINSIK